MRDWKRTSTQLSDKVTILKAVKEKLKIFIIENTELNKLNIHHHIYKIKMNTTNAKHPSKHYNGKV